MNRFCVVFFVALTASTFAEPPSSSHISSSYGAPSISYGAPQAPSGYSYQPVEVSLDYVQQNVGRIPNEGQNIDPNLLNKIKGVLIDHENSGGNKVVHVVNPSSSYGAPQHSYGPPSSHWSKSSHVVGLDFGHLQQSIPVAYYVGNQRHVSGGSGWDQGNSGWNNQGNSGWNNQGWVKPMPPRVNYGAPPPSRW